MFIGIIEWESLTPSVHTFHGSIFTREQATAILLGEGNQSSAVTRVTIYEVIDESSVAVELQVLYERA